MITNDIKKEFPILSRKINDKELVYLDNSATTQSPNEVIDCMVDFYSNHRANIHRGIHTLAEEATEMYEKSRKNIASFLKVNSNELIFLRNTTEASNLVAFTFLNKLKPHSTILISEFEHHSNLIPWQRGAKDLKLEFKAIPLNENNELDLEFIKNQEFSFIALNHVSNFLGNINPISEVISISKDKGAFTYIDGAQSVAHIPLNLKNLDCDFYSFSGHKLYGPFGIGGLYVKKDILKNMPPFLTGGGMIHDVKIEESTYLDLAEKYDAGTPNVSGAICLSKAVDFVNKIGIKNINIHEKEVLAYLYSSLEKIKNIDIYGTKNLDNRASLVSFNIKGIHSHDLASILDTEGIAVRSGTHCTMPIHQKLNINSSCRASLGLYNFKEDVDRLIEAINKALKLLL